MIRTSKLVVTGKQKLEYVNANIPELGERQVLVKGLISGISHGTELAVLDGTTPTFHKLWDADLRCYIDGEPSKKYPASLGYEYVGEVVKIGKKVNKL